MPYCNNSLNKFTILQFSSENNEFKNARSMLVCYTSSRVCIRSITRLHVLIKMYFSDAIYCFHRVQLNSKTIGNEGA